MSDLIDTGVVRTRTVQLDCLGHSSTVVIFTIDEVLDVSRATIPHFPIPILNPLLGNPAVRDAVAISVALLELTVAQKLRPQSALDRVVFVLNELAEKIWRNTPRHDVGIHFDTRGRVLSGTFARSIESQPKEQRARIDCRGLCF